MAFRFNADEILQMAAQIERNGAKFYRRAAEAVEDAHSQSLLRELSAMEEDHEKSFAELEAALTPEERKEVVFDPDDQNPLYLQAMADRRVFDIGADPWDRLEGEVTMEKIIELAISLEKDSVVFYEGVKEMVPARLGGKRVDDIIKEELGHIATLSDLRRCLRT